ncbi:MAG: apolipoprotein N-acyltransferase [Woeseiaceae bacterium]
MADNISLAILSETQPRLVNFAFFLCGALLMLSFAPFGWYVLAPLLLVPFLYSTLHSSPKQAAWHGFWLGAGLFLAGTYWLYISIHVFGQAPLIIAIVIMLGLVFIMGCYYAVSGWLICRLCEGNVGRFLLLAPAVWVFVEWLRGWFLSGFPWMSMGYGQIDSTLSAFAPLAGVYAVSIFVIVSAAALTAAISAKNKNRYWLLLLAVLPWLMGSAMQNIAWTKDAGPSVKATIVQGGVSQDRKWLREQFMPTLDLYRESISANADSALIVWPEVAIPAARDQVDAFIEVLQTELAIRGQTLLFGILERDSETDKVWNSVFSLQADAEQVYRKRHLVPFGEFFPVPAFVREWMRMMSLPYSDISAGAPVQDLLTMADGNKLAVAICYEDAYGAEQLYALPEASILINVSNDAWFGDSIAPHQHLEIARMRALEVGRHVIRATNNGVSAFIGPYGEIVQAGEQFTYVAMSHDVMPRKGLTPYARVGNWPVILLCTALIVAFSRSLRRKT